MNGIVELIKKLFKPRPAPQMGKSTWHYSQGVPNGKK